MAFNNRGAAASKNILLKFEAFTIHNKELLIKEELPFLKIFH